MFGKSKGKGKAKETSGSTSKSKKRRVDTRQETDVEMPDSPHASQQEEEEAVDQWVTKPDWKRGPLSNYPRRWQEQLFRDKMNTLLNKNEAFICEREVPESQFGPFGIHDKFRALGWEDALKCYDGSNTKVYTEEIEEWMATLRNVPGNNPPITTKFVGTVNGIEVTMSFSTLRQIARFDSKNAKSYKYPSPNDLYFEPDKHPSWPMMISSLFKANRNENKLLREDLLIEPKLLLMIVQQNVMPRRGDKREVRYPEVPILYTLMNGTPLLSFKYVVMSNIWLSRESHERRIIPHCRLITALLKSHGAIREDAVPAVKRNTPFELKSLGPIWQYKSSERYHKLRTEGQRWKVLKVNARPLETGEQDEEDSVDVVESGDDDYEERPSRGMGLQMEHGGVGSSRGAGSSAGAEGFSGSGAQSFGQNWAYQGSVEDAVQSVRPNDYYRWPELTRTMFDQNTRLGVMHERSLKEHHDHYEQWNRTHAYAFQQEINDRYEDDQRRRMHEAWRRGEEVVEDPMLVDYTSLAPYDGSVYIPVPAAHHSRWIDPRETMQQPPPPPSEGNQDAFGFGEFNDVMTSIFGPPGPKYY